MGAFLAAVVEANPKVLEARSSRLEGPTYYAVWLASDAGIITTLLKSTCGEFVNVHSEGSTHLVLSLADATRAIELFWAERHSMSGVLGGHIPWNYVLVYALRSEEEFDTWKTIVAASLKLIITASGLSGCDPIEPMM